MNLEFRDSAGNSIAIDTLRNKDLEVEFGPVSYRTRTINRYSRDGAESTGDKSADPRSIIVRFVNMQKNLPPTISDPLYWALPNQIDGMFARNENAPFYLVDTDNNRRAEIQLKEYGDQAIQGNVWRAGNNRMSFDWLSSTWEDLTEQTASSITGGIDNDETINIDNDAELKTYPIFVVSPVLSTINQFTIRNTTNGAACRITAGNFAVGTTITIDAVAGTIFLSDGTTDIESSSALANRFGFIIFDPDVNVIKYQSAYGAVDMTIKWRRQYRW